jgi:ribosomal protein L17
MTSYLEPLLKKRLATIEKELAKCQVVIDERASDYFDFLKAFNDSKNIDEKLKLAKQAQARYEKLRTWTKRSDVAWQRRGKLELERDELINQLFYIKRRNQ